MSEEDKLVLGTLTGVDLILSPEHYEEYKGTLNKQIETINKELDQYKNNWEGLKKWLKEEIERLMKVEQSNNVIFLIGAYDEVLSKMKELEEDK